VQHQQHRIHPFAIVPLPRRAHCWGGALPCHPEPAARSNATACNVFDRAPLGDRAVPARHGGRLLWATRSRPRTADSESTARSPPHGSPPHGVHRTSPPHSRHGAHDTGVHDSPDLDSAHQVAHPRTAPTDSQQPATCTAIKDTPVCLTSPDFPRATVRGIAVGPEARAPNPPRPGGTRPPAAPVY
jgi:hypothetical protein